MGEGLAGGSREHPVPAEGRAVVYGLLARALDYPGEDLAAELVAGEFVARLRWAGTGLIGEECLAGEAGAIADYTASFTDRDGERRLLLELQKDYTRLSFASKPRLVPLFESVYREGKLLQESTFEVARLYHEAGLRLRPGFTLPPDHIALELECMAYLCFQEAVAAGVQDGEKREKEAVRLQREVLGQHLGEFGARFAERLKAHAGTSFYRSVARLLADFLAREETRLLPVPG
ncbi:MAG: molecular chaperone TorD family protein [Firmicutes bacterium]|nr:molecular chaperone TorD family protein [Bacillota bacterium]